MSDDLNSRLEKLGVMAEGERVCDGGEAFMSGVGRRRRVRTAQRVLAGVGIVAMVGAAVVMMKPGAAPVPQVRVQVATSDQGKEGNGDDPSAQREMARVHVPSPLTIGALRYGMNDGREFVPAPSALSAVARQDGPMIRVGTIYSEEGMAALLSQ